ncbi:MAG: hypothetical protein M2R45_02061 [Verrucomicrobia subdivision 3 bacterium]|nr:hypothetical protein [Limisphaerales bacterium]MCS1414880.1 hypothetical protein [Limisphaerales bacterium]
MFGNTSAKGSISPRNNYPQGRQKLWAQSRRYSPRAAYLQLNYSKTSTTQITVADELPVPSLSPARQSRVIHFGQWPQDTNSELHLIQPSHQFPLPPIAGRSSFRNIYDLSPLRALPDHREQSAPQPSD